MTLISSFVLTASAQTVLDAGIKSENLDTTVQPGTDFYQFACGGWMKNNPLPAAYSRFGSFDKLGKTVDKQINDILTELLASTYAKGTEEQKVSDLYRLAMDSVRRNTEGLAPIMPYLTQLNECKSVKDVKAWLLKQVPYGSRLFYQAYYGADEKDSKNNILDINQGGLTLGQKEFYTATDSASLALLEDYRKHITAMFTIAGFAPKKAEKKMQNVMSVEMRLAGFSRTRVELRDVEKNYNKMTSAEFLAKYPNLMLTDVMTAMGVERKYYEHIVVGQPDFCEGLNALLPQLTTDELRDYYLWRLINGAANLLSDNLRDEHFHFNGEIRSGRKEQHPRWKTATSQVQGVMGEALGRIYVKKHFSPEAKERMLQLVRNLQISLGERIDAQEWMSEETKKQAHEKLDAFYVKIGYPDKWDDLTNLVIDPSLSYYENMRNANRFLQELDLAKTVGKPVDREQWYMYPQTVNAYYNPTTNEICFPAGILQPPFFDNNADDAFNYGAIGVVIGHEMTHGFDDQGAHFDKDGNMHDWWTEDDMTKFKALGKQYADYFDTIELLPGLYSNGKQTLGENLADHGGLQVSWQAYQNAKKQNAAQNGGTDPNDIEKLGFTADQRFFMAYAGVWAQTITEQEIRNRLKTDVHSQGEWRVKGALPHIDAWYQAFGIQPTDKMYLKKEDRLNLW